MDRCFKNSTLQTYFTILGFSTSTNGRLLLFTVFLLVYLIAVAANLTIITLVCRVAQLHTSMYFFLCNLAILDIIYITSTLPKLLFISFTYNHIVSYASCITQLYFFLFCADAESFLLTSMAVDRYVAICVPLHYSLIMCRRTCVLLSFPAWFMGAMNALILTWFIIGLSFSDLNEINNYFCDLKALLSVSCSDTTYLRSFIVVDGMFIGAIPLLLTLMSYMCIISTILKIQTSKGRLKAFSSCTSHVCIVILYYGSALCLYMRYSQAEDKIFSVIFATLVPLLNPLVYSLRNKVILRALKNCKTLKDNF